MKRIIFKIATIALIFAIPTQVKAWNTDCIMHAYTYGSGEGYGKNEAGNHCGRCGTNCDWEIESGILKITGTGDNVVLGHTYNSESTNNEYRTPMTGTPWQPFYEEFSAVDIKGVATVSYGSFKGLKNVTQVTFDDTLTNIGYGAFEYTGLTSVTLPKNANISERAFYNTESLTEVIIPQNRTIDTGCWIFGNRQSTTNIRTIKCQSESGNWKGCYPSYSATCTTPYTSIAIPECPANCYSCDSEGKCTTCLHGKLNKEGSCIEQSACNSDEGYLIDTASANCRMLPGCDTFENGKCTTCIDDYLTNSDGTCTPVADCKNGLHAEDGACVANDDVNCNTQEGNKCTECKGGYLEQDGGCVTSCGVGYKQFENWCNRIQYTPAQAAAILNDDNNTITITFKK